MKLDFKKLLPIAGILSVGMITNAFADSNYGSSGSNGRSYQSSSSMSSQQGSYERGTYREITPNAGPRVAAGADVFITANFIWWKPVQEGLNYAHTGFVDSSQITAATPFPSVSKGSFRRAEFDFEPGFKVGLGLNLGHDGWDIFAQYTWLHSSTSNSVSRTPDLVAPTFGSTLLGDRATGRWKFHFNVLDLELGRNFYVSQFLTLRPHFGLKGTWQDNRLRVKLQSDDGFNIAGNNVTVNYSGPFRSTWDTDTWGIGTRAGLNTAWFMAKNWSIYGDIAWTAMWADFDMDRHDRVEGDDGTLTLYHADQTLYSVKNILELGLGLRWETWFDDDNYHFMLQLGWEEQVWVNWGMYVDLLDRGTTNDLTLHGLNFKARFDF